MKGRTQLRRELGLFSAVMMGMGGAMSAGGFVILGYAAGLCGSAIVIVVFFCGILSLLTMLSYCELGTTIPQAGGEYTFVKASFGGFPAFLTGWFEWFSNVFYSALSAIGFAYIIAYLAPIDVRVTAILMVVLFTAINIRGVKEVGTAESIITVVVLAVLAVYAGGGWALSRGIGEFKLSAPGGLSGMLAATAFLFDLYLGAEAIAVAQAEIKDPEKTIPRAMILSSVALIAVYTAVTYTTVRIVPAGVLSGKTSPIAFAAEQVMGRFGGLLITVGVAMAGLATINESVMAQSRVLYALSRDGYFPRALSEVHGRFGTPHRAILVSSVFTAALAATGAVNFVVYAVNLGFFIGFTFVNLSVIRLRRRKPHQRRPFRVPLYPITPALGIVTSLVLLVVIARDAPSVLTLGAEISVLALLVYYLGMMGYRRLRAAVGGINLGIGGFTALLIALARMGRMPILAALSSGPPLYGAVLVAVLFTLAGVLNLAHGERR